MDALEVIIFEFLLRLPAIGETAKRVGQRRVSGRWNLRGHTAVEVALEVRASRVPVCVSGGVRCDLVIVVLGRAENTFLSIADAIVGRTVITDVVGVRFVSAPDGLGEYRGVIEREACDDLDPYRVCSGGRRAAHANGAKEYVRDVF